MSTFKQQRADIFYDVMLDSSEFAEIFTVKEPGKADRQVYGKRSADDADQALMQQYLENNEEVLAVRFGKNEGHTKGGVANPLLGLAIVRTGEETLKPYAFTGKILKTTEHSWTLLFARPTFNRAAPLQ
jgi:hypothetical protein